jgi:magnesium chelatase subunit I
VLVFGDRGTGKSTAVRALAQLLPKMKVVAGSPTISTRPRWTIRTSRPGRCRCRWSICRLGATEDRVVGALDIEKALTQGERAFQPGLLAQANRGFLYIDEINLLEDHLVDLLLDVAASGENVVEREGLSIRHPARFVLIGSGNPEEGELRPQLLIALGCRWMWRRLKTSSSGSRLCAGAMRSTVTRRPLSISGNARMARSAARLSVRVTAWTRVAVSDEILGQAAQLCMALGTDGLRGELTLMRAARAHAALEGQDEVTKDALRLVARWCSAIGCDVIRLMIRAHRPALSGPLPN